MNATVLPDQSTNYRGVDHAAVITLSRRVSEVNIQTRLKVDEEDWPPGQPKTFTPLVLIQYQGHHNLRKSAAIAEFVEQGHIDEVVTSCNAIHKDNHILHSREPLEEVLNTSKVTKEVAEILTPLEISDDPQFILIEGAPGIGKSILLKQIAYLWGIKQVLQRFKLVLLVCLRDPAIHKMSMIDDLLQSFCKRDKRATEIASACSDYLLENNGEDLALLFDGYDEYPEMLQKESLIADILNRKVLPRCCFIVSSRPHASVSLREQATVRVDILGFTIVEREHYIKESMKGQPQKINELTQYLQSHLKISSLCFVPFNMVALVHLYKLGIPLPKNSAELYNFFICVTVNRHLIKHGHHLQSNITELVRVPNLTNLPEPYNKIIQQLSKFSLEALNHNKLVFTLDEIKAACPDITTFPGAINGFGLLQAVEHFGLIGTTTTFNFLHFSIQEYLAAHHIVNLPADEELRFIEKNFWKDIYMNMFSLYITLTKGQRPSFKHFLCSGNKAVVISDKFLNNQLQCIRLYHCYHEVGDVDICNAIEKSKIFGKKEIDLGRYRALTASDVDCVTVFLTLSIHKEWRMLNLYNCYIQNHGLHILHRGILHNSDITIDKLGLHYNGLTMQSSSLISDITVKYKVKELIITGNNTIGENEQLYFMLSDFSAMLKELYMSFIKLSSRGAVALFTALKYNSKLKVLYVSYNNVTDDACNAITTALESNKCLSLLSLFKNPFSDEALISIANDIKTNNTLEELRLPKCPDDVQKRIHLQQEFINKKRESQGYKVKLLIKHW